MEKYMEPEDRISREAAKRNSCSSSVREEENVKSGDWSFLPEMILNTVFTYLPRTDQVSASQVCRNWSRAMDNPNLWRKMDIDLRDATLENLQRNLRFAKRYGHHLRYLTIDYEPVRLWYNAELERPLITFIDDIHRRAQLRYFKLQRFDLDRGKPESSLLSHKFRNSLCRFLKTQHLSEVVIRYHDHTMKQGYHILQAIAKGSGSTLQTLVLENLSLNPQYAVFSNKTSLSILANFKHLEVVSFDYYCVSEEVILCLAHNCAGRLRSLVIRCDSEEVNFQTIGNDIWKQFKRECPNVLVDFHIFEVEGLETLKRLVPCQVPLKFLQYKTSELSAGEEALGPSNFLSHVFSHFENTLEDLELNFDHTVPNVGTILEEFLPSLKNLKRLVVKAKISDAFVEKVNAMRELKLIHLSEFLPTKCDRISLEIRRQRFLSYFS